MQLLLSVQLDCGCIQLALQALHDARVPQSLVMCLVLQGRGQKGGGAAQCGCKARLRKAEWCGCSAQCPGCSTVHTSAEQLVRYRTPTNQGHNQVGAT